MQTLTQYIARELIKGTRRKFGRLHSDYLQEITMSQAIQHPKTDAQIAEREHAEKLALLNRVAELETRIAALEGKN